MQMNKGNIENTDWYTSKCTEKVIILKGFGVISSLFPIFSFQKLFDKLLNYIIIIYFSSQ